MEITNEGEGMKIQFISQSLRTSPAGNDVAMRIANLHTIKLQMSRNLSLKVFFALIAERIKIDG